MGCGFGKWCSVVLVGLWVRVVVVVAFLAILRGLPRFLGVEGGRNGEDPAKTEDLLAFGSL